MKKLNLILGCVVLLLVVACNRQMTSKTSDAKEKVEDKIVEVGVTPTTKYKYETVPNDPLNTKIYTLKNGMKVYMTVNKNEPRIQTNIAVRAGSKHDPADGTGLAHYLEHMLFKGTDKVGSLDWEKEKVLLQEISDLYEKHKAEKDPAKRKAIYAQIDKVSGEAAKLVAANEYDKMISSLGAKGTNAYTSIEQTVYINDIPSNELERWFEIESERFSMLVLRLFHTELEAVYEEFNRAQPVDTRKGNAALANGLFPSHPYGTQTTIGTSEHLKSPSHVQIHDYFNKYYQPNNMAIIISGDFDPDNVVELAEKNFGHYERKAIPELNFEAQPKLTGKVVKEIIGQQDEYVDLAYRIDAGAGSDEQLMSTLISGLLTNGQAGVMDLDLLQEQKVLEADAWVWDYEDYTAFGLYGKPRKGQSLEEVEKLMMESLENLKAGKFEDWLMDAVIKDKKLAQMKQYESNRGRTASLVASFTKGIDWTKYNQQFERMSKFTKQDVMAFAKKHFKDNYVIVYKRSGEDKDIVNMEKPAITPIEVNREDASPFLKKFMTKKGAPVAPVFLDYKKDIKSLNLPNGLDVNYIKNTSNETFSLYYILDMGKNHDKVLPLAVDYLPYLGTDKYSAKDLQQEFFKLGVNFSVFTSDDQVYVTLSGLDESFEEGVKLFEHILANAKPDAAALEGVVGNILKGRENTKKNKQAILFGGMQNYARHGAVSSYTDILSAKELKALKGEDLVAKIKDLTNYKHKVFYYGSKRADQVTKVLAANHKVPAKLKDLPKAKTYPELATEKNRVLFVDFQMAQAEVYMVSKGDEKFDVDQYAMSSLYNGYFGSGLSSIVFQEIRESKALAYSAGVGFGSPAYADRAHYMRGYIGTQVNKLPEAIDALSTIVNDMPVSEAQIENARQSVMKRIETSRTTGPNVYFSAQSAKRRGVDYDLNTAVYEKMKNFKVEDLVNFQKEHVKGRKFTYLVIGDKSKIDLEYLKKLGEFKELSLEEVFGY